MTRTIVYQLVGGPLDGAKHSLAQGWEGVLIQLPSDRWAWYVLQENVLRFVRYETCFDKAVKR